MVDVEINTIEVVFKGGSSSDALSDLEISLRDIGIEGARAFSTQTFTFRGDLAQEKIKPVSELVHHDFNQHAYINQPLQPEAHQEWDFAVKVDFKPGVTDNAARVVHHDLSLVGVDTADVFTSNTHYIKGEFNESFRDMLERVASNPKIHKIDVLSRDNFVNQGGFDHKPEPVNLGDRANYFWIDLGSMDDNELRRTGSLGTLNLDLVKPEMDQEDIDDLRGGTLSLVSNLPGNEELDYMYAFKKYSLSDKNTSVGRKPGFQTDVELELIAQMWSEHCRHSLYNAAFPGCDRGIFDAFIKEPTLEVLKEKPHLGVSIYKDNSGVFQFNEKWNLLVKNETHNSPSALDPYGGAITGTVGVNRDPFGTGIGAEVIANWFAYWLGHLFDRRKHYKRKKVAEPVRAGEAGQVAASYVLEELMLNPKQIYDGVVSGVGDGANKMGISLNIGTCQFHDRYNGKPIVGVGSIGRQPRFVNGEPAHEKRIDPGDRLYIAGGRAGVDGIHGATFSSEELAAISPAAAVQIGDPYTQKKMFDALLEARDKGYIKFITDLGAGGTCCAALEMGANVIVGEGKYGGLEADLDKLLVKYPDMTATELFLNESQERMAIAVNPEHAEAFEAILKKHEVEYSDIGKFTDKGRAVVHAKGEEVVNLDMEFIHSGFPDRVLQPVEYRLPEEEQSRLEIGLEESIEDFDLEHGDDSIRVEFYEMLKRPNLSSVAPITDKMDSTVKGLQVQHCIQGKGRVSTKTACTLVDRESTEGIIQSFGFAERQSYIDSEKMGKNAFLRAIGNAVAMGGRLDYMVATDQALWQSSNKGEYQQMLIEGNRGMSQVIEGCKIPVISGKDSMYNQARIYDEGGNEVSRGIFPTILMYAFAKIDNVCDIVTVDAKEEGDLVYVVGATTKADMGGSEFVNMHSERQGVEFNVGQVSDENIDDVFDTYEKMNQAQQEGLLQSAKYVEAGGLAIALRDTATAGERGIEFNLNAVHQAGVLESHELKYSETEGRFLVTVKPEYQEKFEELFKGKLSRIGVVKGNDLVMKEGDEVILNEGVNDMLKEYHREAA